MTTSDDILERQAESKSALFDTIFYSVIKILPRSLLSWFIGFIARIPWTGPIGTMFNSIFVKLFRINMDEAERPISEYKSIEDVFSRGLKVDARPILGEPCYPCDGFMSQGQNAHRQSALQVKGHDYSLPVLVFGDDHTKFDVNLAWYSTIYLAPSDYHRVHTPFSGFLESIRYIPGDLWPVNAPFVRILPGLFNKNERMVFELRPEFDENARIFVVMVGALNVGRIESKWLSQFVSNDFYRQFKELGFHKKFVEKIQLKAGDELGKFLLGSTTVIVCDELTRDHFKLPLSLTQKSVKLGQSIG